MGSLLAGYVLTDEPDLAKLKESCAGTSFRLYRHKRDKFWLLDTYRESRQRDHYPFSDYVSAKGDGLRDAFPEAQEVARVAAYHQADFLKYEIGWLRSSRRMSSVLRQIVFGFLSDDEGPGTTCVYDSGRTVRIHCGMDRLDMLFDNGKFIFRPVSCEEDSELEPPVALIKELATMPNVTVGMEVRIPGGGQWLHQQVIDDWPPDAGDGKSLGISEGIPELDFDFEVVGILEAKAPKPPEKRQSWLASLLQSLSHKAKAPSSPVPRPLSGSEIASRALENVQRSLVNAARFEREGNRQFQILNLHTVCEELLVYTLYTHDRPEDAAKFIRNRDGGEHLKKALRVAQKNDDDRIARGLPVGGPISGTPDIDAHFAWLIGEYEVGCHIIQICEDPRRGYRKDPLWKYLSVMKSFCEKSPCECDVSSGFEHANPLLPACALLMADLASGRPLETSLAKVDEAWRRLNLNRRVESSSVDGNGVQPVKWNFRLASIAALARQLYGLDITG